ncbi:MAG: pyrroloquinoline quinone precursor peptide PqqA [Gemmatimonadaceae bacterium]
MLINALRESQAPAYRVVRALHWITGRRTDSRPDWVISPTFGDWIPLGSRHHNKSGGCPMSWTKPEFEVVEVTMEVTAYVARR